jgi:transglutaminase-like putative cysteine protease
MIAAARTLEIPARYVSGYLFSGEGDARAEASHAWAELWIEGLGWVGFDASNDCCPDERYIRLGSGFDAIDGAPIRGISQGAGVEKLEVSVDVAQVQQ